MVLHVRRRGCHYGHTHVWTIKSSTLNVVCLSCNEVTIFAFAVTPRFLRATSNKIHGQTLQGKLILLPPHSPNYTANYSERSAAPRRVTVKLLFFFPHFPSFSAWGKQTKKITWLNARARHEHPQHFWLKARRIMYSGKAGGAYRSIALVRPKIQRPFFGPL